MGNHLKVVDIRLVLFSPLTPLRQLIGAENRTRRGRRSWLARCFNADTSERSCSLWAGMNAAGALEQT